MIEQSREVVAANKVVIGATAVSLIGWFARKPLLGLAGRLIKRYKLERLLPWRVE